VGAIEQAARIMYEPLEIILATAATWLAIFAAVAARPAEHAHKRKY